MVKGLSFKKTIKRILIEQSDEYYKISPKEFEELMKFGEYNGNGVSKLKIFGGRPIWITGDLDLSNTPTNSLGNVRYVEGRLDISKTNISDLSGVAFACLNKVRIVLPLVSHTQQCQKFSFLAVVRNDTSSLFL